MCSVQAFVAACSPLGPLVSRTRVGSIGIINTPCGTTASADYMLACSTQQCGHSVMTSPKLRWPAPISSMIESLRSKRETRGLRHSGTNSCTRGNSKRVLKLLGACAAGAKSLVMDCAASVDPTNKRVRALCHAGRNAFFSPILSSRIEQPTNLPASAAGSKAPSRVGPS